MKIAYDLHIHTALSPCGDGDMTPNNIINMAVLKGLDAIAITDHNSCGNVLSCMKCAEGKNLLVIPGLEVETAEECHIICLFPELENALQMEDTVKASLPQIANRPAIFGEQVYLDEYDNITGYEENLLVTATTLSVDKVAELVRRLGGVAIPAHIDKAAYSVISNLGFIDDVWGFKTIEVRDFDKAEKMYEEKDLGRFDIIHSSDAHYLWDISEREYYFDAEKLNAQAIIDRLSKQN